MKFKRDNTELSLIFEMSWRKKACNTFSKVLGIAYYFAHQQEIKLGKGD